MPVNVGTLMVEVGANVARLQQDMGKASRQVENFAAGVKRTATALASAWAAVQGAQAVGAFVKQTLDAGDKLAKMSRSAGIAVETLSALDHAANLSGTSTESMAQGLNIMAKNLADIAGSGNDTTRALAALHIQARDVEGRFKSTDAIMLEVADRFAGMEDGANKTAIAMALFGRSGASMIPMLNEGAEGIARMEQEARDLGLTLDQVTAARIELVNDNITRLHGAAQGFGRELIYVTLPAVSDISTAMVDLSKNVHILAGPFEYLWDTFTRFDSRIAASLRWFKILGTVAEQLPGMVQYGFTKEDYKAFDFEAASREVMARRREWEGQPVKVAGPDFTASLEKVKTYWLTVEEIRRRASKAQAEAWAARRGTGADGGLKDLERSIQAQADEASRLDEQYRDLRSTMAGLASEDMTWGAQQARELQAALEEAAQAAERAWGVGAAGALRDYADEAMNAAENMRTAFTGAMGEVEQSITDALMNGKMQAEDLNRLLKAIEADFVNAAVRQTITGPASSGLASIFAGLFHGGGVVGSSGASRMVDPSIFMGAPRFHTGLASDEYPAILQRGETVIPRGGAAVAGSIRNEFVFQNAPAGTSIASREQLPGGGERVIIQLSGEIARQDLALGGPMSRTMESLYGLTRQGRR